jgi:nucleoside phosphorylase
MVVVDVVVVVKVVTTKLVAVHDVEVVVVTGVCASAGRTSHAPHR